MPNNEAVGDKDVTMDEGIKISGKRQGRSKKLRVEKDNIVADKDANPENASPNLEYAQDENIVQASPTKQNPPTSILHATPKRMTKKTAKRTP